MVGITQGSNDKENWTTLMEHSQDATMDKKGALGIWALPATCHNSFYRYFRIVLTGRNSNQNTYLACSGFEVSGLLSLA